MISKPVIFFLVSIIRLYQFFLSPLLGSCCRFSPSCSSYFIQALRERGVVYGLWLGIWRLLRCNPFCEGGYDPVPVKKNHFNGKRMVIRL